MKDFFKCALHFFFWTALMIIKTGLIISPKESPQQFWERSDNFSLESCWFRGEMLNIRETVYWEAIFWSSWCLRLFMIRTFIVQNLISNQKRFNLFFQKRFFFLSWWYFLVAIFKVLFFTILTLKNICDDITILIRHYFFLHFRHFFKVLIVRKSVLKI